MIEITKAEYLKNPSKYIEMSSGETQVKVIEDGQVVVVLGWGKLPPVTEEEDDLSDVKDEFLDWNWLD